MAKSSTRRVNIYINGKEVETTVKQIRAEINKLVSEQNRMTIGSDEYIIPIYYREFLDCLRTA